MPTLSRTAVAVASAATLVKLVAFTGTFLLVVALALRPARGTR